MIVFSEKEMQNLSFPDFDIEAIEFLPKDKKLMISVEGAWLDIDGGYQLGKGTLYFNDWENLVVSNYDPDTEQWLIINNPSIDPLKDLCEFKFNGKSIYLYGFGKNTGHWIEWKIQNTKMSAKFDAQPN